MSIFHDTEKRAWDLRVNVASVRRVKALLNVDLLQPELGEPPLLTKLCSDIILLVDIIYVLVKPQADELKISDEQFGAALGGEAIQSAQRVLYEELTDFFQRLGRSDIAKALKKQLEVVELAVAKITAHLDKMDTTEMVDRIVGKLSTN